MKKVKELMDVIFMGIMGRLMLVYIWMIERLQKLIGRIWSK